MKNPNTTKPQKQKKGPPDRLIKTRGAAKIELSEDELRKVSGGTDSHLWGAQAAHKATKPSRAGRPAVGAQRLRRCRCVGCQSRNAICKREMAMKNRDKDTGKTRKRKPASAPDRLVKGGRGAKIDLTEDDLRRISGGATADFWKAAHKAT